VAPLAKSQDAREATPPQKLIKKRAIHISIA
jgi:hypothetical protein